MGLVSVGLKSAYQGGVVGKSWSLFRHRAMKRAKISVGRKASIAVTSAVAGVAAKSAAEAAANKVQQLDSAGPNEQTLWADGSTWSLTGMFLPDETFELFGRLVLELNPVAIGSRVASFGINAGGRLAESAAGLVSRRAANRLRISRMNAARRANKIGRFGLSKKGHRRLAKGIGQAADVGLAVAETFGTGGLGLAGKAGAKVATKVAAVQLRSATRKSVARRVARATMRAAVK